MDIDMVGRLVSITTKEKKNTRIGIVKKSTKSVGNYPDKQLALINRSGLSLLIGNNHLKHFTNHHSKVK